MIKRIMMLTMCVFVIFQRIMEVCIAPVAGHLNDILKSSQDVTSTPVHKIVRALESGLSYQFHASWGLVLQLFSVIYKVRIF